VVRLAGARIEAAFAAAANQLAIALALLAILFFFPVTALLGHGLHGADRLADGLAAIAVAGFLHVLVAGHADVFAALLADRPAGGAANFAVASFAHRLADLAAHFFAVLLTNLLADLVLDLVAMRFAHRFAHGVGAFLVAGLRDLLADRVLAFLPARLIDGLAAGLRNGLVAGLVARLVASLAFLAVASLAYRLHDSFLHGLVASVPPLFQNRIVNQFVTSAALLLTRGEAALSVATRL